MTSRPRQFVALADQGELFDVLAATAVDGIIVIDEFARVLYYNPACRKLFQYEAREVTGRNVNMLMPEPYQSEHDAYVARYKKTRDPHIIGIGREVTGRRKDGTTFPMLLSVGEGQLGGRTVFVGIIHDLTAIDAQRERAVKLQGELAHVARVNAIGQLSSALAHELNQPLTAIMNFVSAARRRLKSVSDPQAERIAGLLDKTVEQTERAGKIIHRLRAFLEKREADRRAENLNDIVRDAAALGFVGSADENVKLALDLEDDVPLVALDRVQIEQVLVNLIRNAAEAVRSCDTRQVTVSTYKAGPGHVEIAVADTGPGLAEEVSAQLFQPFVTTKEKGMGIGLSISRTIVEAHGGRIWMTPNPGGGTVFRFQLPLES
ncbi:MAG TPA: ATP-binding protein [Rhizomicrobium sp.]|nr:ATP-binding protein [Rhizomicrobium sp.]